MKKDYLEALASPQWQKKRLEIMQRDNFTCQFCGCKDKTLHVHHKIYEKGKKPWEYDNKDLITLCDKCHERITDEKNSLYENFTYARDSFREFGFSDAVFCNILQELNHFFECIKDGEKPCNFDTIRDIIFYAVMWSLNYDDIKTMARLGDKIMDVVKANFPEFLDDYDNTEVDENIKKFLND